MKTRIVEAIVTKLNQKPEEVLVLEIYDDVFGVIDRKVIRWSGEAIDDTHTQSNYTEQRRRQQKARSARNNYHLRKYAA